jgi:diguanylate cyclase (GGDEF)-like protein
MPMVLASITAGGVGLAITHLAADRVVTTIVCLLGVSVAFRTACAFHFRKSAKNGMPVAPLWAHSYEGGSWACAALFGLLALATLVRSGDAAVHVLSVALAAAYAGGIASRNAGRMASIVGHSILVLAPTALGLWLAGGTGYRVLSIAMAIMMVGMMEIGAHTHRIVMEALRGQREKALLASKYERLARFDSLTGVENRMAMQMRLRDLFERNRKPQDAVAILWMDLDRFKEINDSLGHMVGDQLLCQVTEKLMEALDGRGYVARFGGDEFILVCPDTDRDTARAIAEDVMAYFQHGFEIGQDMLNVTASIGIAVGPQDGRAMDELMKHADVALYQAKREGRNRAVCFTWSMKERFNRANLIETGLRRAIENQELSLHYQPIFDLATGKVAVCEALMRWTHPTLGRVPPSEFIPAAEAIGVIEALSEWALRQACAAAAQWPNGIRVAVNISPASLASGDLPRTIIAILLESGLPARRLELEVTESLFLEDNRHTSQMLKELQLIGLKLVLDDFGTGYSSLSYLRSYRFDTIKVDQSFMADIGHSKEDQAIIQAVGQIARSLEMTTVAEGIETEEQFRHARAAGFTEGQGFLLCPPQPEDIIARMLAEGLEMPASLTPAPAPVVRRRRA